MNDEQKAFCEHVWAYYAHNARVLPWRQLDHKGTLDSYHVLVSEIMLQQTQVSRVQSKYVAFLEKFPSIESLAAAPLGDVVRMWQGLGYNRRAKLLWQSTQMICAEYSGVIPQAVNELVRLPGIGKNTAAALCCYAFNMPEPFIETNIRTVYIHHFFPDVAQVSDAEIWPIIQDTWDTEHPREWGWALMDYGSHLKATIGNAGQRSVHHIKQSVFEGSRRQLRGWVLRQLSKNQCSGAELYEMKKDDRLTNVLESLEKEGFITLQDGSYRLV